MVDCSLHNCVKTTTRGEETANVLSIVQSLLVTLAFLMQKTRCQNTYRYHRTTVGQGLPQRWKIVILILNYFLTDT